MASGGTLGPQPFFRCPFEGSRVGLLGVCVWFTDGYINVLIPRGSFRTLPFPNIFCQGVMFCAFTRWFCLHSLISSRSRLTALFVHWMLYYMYITNSPSMGPNMSSVMKGSLFSCATLVASENVYWVPWYVYITRWAPIWPLWLPPKCPLVALKCIYITRWAPVALSYRRGGEKTPISSCNLRCIPKCPFVAMISMLSSGSQWALIMTRVVKRPLFSRVTLAVSQNINWFSNVCILRRGP